jgi:hypothetical protein
MTDVINNQFTAAIQQASADLAGAKAGRDQAAAREQRGAAQKQEVVDRLAEMAETKAKIMADRRNGNFSIEHGPALAIIAADGELLTEELAKRERDLAQAAAVLADADNHVARAEAALAEVEHHIELNGLLGQAASDRRGLLRRDQPRG